MTAATEMAQLTRRRVRRWWVVPFLIGALIALGGARLRGWPDRIIGIDINQHRANVPAAIPNDDLALAQTFVPNRDGFYEIELIIYQAGEPSDGELTLELLDDDGNLVGSQVLQTADLVHNQQITLRFAAQEESADIPYTLQVSGRNNTNTTLWGFDLEAISSGQLTPMSTTAQDLRTVTRYQLTPKLMMQRGSELFLSGILPVAILLWVVLVVGWTTVRSLGKRLQTDDWPTNVATLLAVGISVWPLLWLWLTTIGGRWGRVSLWLLLILLTIGMLARMWRERDEIGRISLYWQQIVLVVLLLGGYFVRLLAIRDLAFPAWVDASRHGLITAVMRDSGQFLQDYGDYLPIETAPLYHFGYHSLTSTIALLTNIELPHLLLTTGQLLNGAIPLAIYACAYLLTRQRTIGLCAAFFVAFPSFFPAYYASWGRYTQLTGMIVFALLLGWCYRISDKRTPSFFYGQESRMREKPRYLSFTRRQDFALLILAAILGAGLFLIHFRVFLIFLPFGLLIYAFNFWQRRQAIEEGLIPLQAETTGAAVVEVKPSQAGTVNREAFDSSLASAAKLNWWQLPAVGLLTFLLVLPRFWQMATYVTVQQVSGEVEGYNDFPFNYVTIGWERWFLLAALLVVIVAIWQYGRRLRWRHLLLVVGLLVYVWVGEWLGSIPAAFDISYVRAGMVGLLLLFSFWWYESADNWMLIPITWIIFEPFFDTQSDKLVLGILLLMTVWLLRWHGERSLARVPIMLTAAVGLLFFLLAGKRVGLPETWILNLNSAYITLFLPLSIVFGVGLYALGERAKRAHWLAQTLVYMLLGVGMTLLTLYGGHRQIEIMNRATILAESPDVTGIAWIAENVPVDAKIAVNGWRWLGTTWAAQDGGAWILPLTKRAVTLPPADYAYERMLEAEVRTFNEQAQAVENWSADSAIALLREQLVTHIYVGARGGFLLPDKLMQHEAIVLRFARDGVFIFELLPEFQ